MNRRQAAAEGRHALDRALLPYRERPTRRPPRGWIRALRDALGMTAEQLGERMSVSPQILTTSVQSACAALSAGTLDSQEER